MFEYIDRPLLPLFSLLDVSKQQLVGGAGRSVSGDCSGPWQMLVSFWRKCSTARWRAAVWAESDNEGRGDYLWDCPFGSWPLRMNLCVCVCVCEGEDRADSITAQFKLYPAFYIDKQIIKKRKEKKRFLQLCLFLSRIRWEDLISCPYRKCVIQHTLGSHQHRLFLGVWAGCLASISTGEIIETSSKNLMSCLELNKLCTKAHVCKI